MSTDSGRVREFNGADRGTAPCAVVSLRRPLDKRTSPIQVIARQGRSRLPLSTMSDDRWMRVRPRRSSGVSAGAAAALSVLVLGAWGCEKQYLVVEYSAGATSSSPVAEVTSTETYSTVSPSLRTVTIRLPDQCLTETSARVTGASADSQAIMTSSCGVWLSELERSLTQAGYRVVTWVRGEGGPGAASTNIASVARQLGADAVFVVNSLETSPIRPGSVAGSSIGYFSSNQYGDRLVEAPLNSAQREYMRCIAWQRADYHLRNEEWRRLVGADCPNLFGADVNDRDPTLDIIGLSATLNISVVDAAGGESMWFYRRSVLRQLAASRNIRFLMRGRGLTWRPVAREQASGPAPTADETMTREGRTLAHGMESGDPLAATRLDLVRMVVGDCVSRFNAGVPRS